MSGELGLNANAEAGRSVALNADSKNRGHSATKLLPNTTESRRDNFAAV